MDKLKVEYNRLLPIEGAYNVRDLGGYTTTWNKTVKWNKIFRSDDLYKLTNKDLQYFAEIPIKTYVDFRSSKEISIAPDRKPKSLENEFTLSIEAGSIIDLKIASNEQISNILVNVNKSFVEDSTEIYSRFFKILLEEKNSPLLFHCSAGKDRTGFAAALFLSALKVSRETIFEDYLLSNKYLKDKYTKLLEFNPEYSPLVKVNKEYLEAAFNVIDSKYGGVENYLVNILDVNLDVIREMYTE